MRKRGFTLLETLIVVVIISLLVAVGVPMFSHRIDSTTITVCGSIMSRLEDVRTQILTDSQTAIYSSIDTGGGGNAVYNPNQSFNLLLTPAGTFVYQSTSTTSDDGRNYAPVTATEIPQGDTDWNARFIPSDVLNIRDAFAKLYVRSLLYAFTTVSGGTTVMGTQYPNITITPNTNPSIGPNTPGNNLVLTFTPNPATGGGSWAVSW